MRKMLKHQIEASVKFRKGINYHKHASENKLAPKIFIRAKFLAMICK